MSGLGNYQVAIVGGKRRRQLGGGGLREAAREQDHEEREGRCRVRSELWRTGTPACSRAQNPQLARDTQGHRPKEQLMLCSVTHTHTHTHTHTRTHTHTHMHACTSWTSMDQIGDTAHPRSVTHSTKAHGRPTMCQAVCGHLGWFRIPPNSTWRKLETGEGHV